MANPFIQYLQDTRSELRHVAWPTRAQTVWYALIVVAISVGVAVYLGFFDFLFTTGLSRFLAVLPQQAPPAQVQPATSTSPLTITQLPATTSPVSR